VTTRADAPVEVEAEVEARVDELLAACPPGEHDMPTFLGAQFDAGLAWVHFPRGRGGSELPIAFQETVDRRLRDAGAPSGRMLNTTAYGQGAATILAYGSVDQQERYLRRIFTCEDIWCQLFSEPGSGSDLAGLSTRAVKDGDQWIVNGQKVWTTRGAIARYGLLLARTDPDAPKHAGLTYFVLDLHQPGVTVRPLRQMDGGASFSEVFMADARVPDDERLGDEGQGWAVSNTTLMNERYNFGGAPERGSGAIAGVVRAWNDRVDRVSPAALALRERLLRLWVEAEVQRLTTLRATAARATGRAGAEGSIGKLAGSELGQRIAALGVDLLGADGTLVDGYEPAVDRRDWSLQRAFLGSPSGTIAGGTSAIQRNIIGERVLGLPREPDPFKGRPWSEVPRN
jgi:alkylation response protein AidB-like acyl-CoA dehydrogenase